jgi:hypothetical protein
VDVREHPSDRGRRDEQRAGLARVDELERVEIERDPSLCRSTASPAIVPSYPTASTTRCITCCIGQRRGDESAYACAINRTRD